MKKQNTNFDAFSYVEFEGGAEEPSDIASFYGFNLIRPIEIKKSDKSKEITEASLVFNDSKSLTVNTPYEEKAALLRALQEAQPKIVLPVSFGQFIKEGARDARLNLDIVGSSKSIADSLVLFTTFNIAKKYYGNSITLSIGSIGDKESSASFVKDTTNYFRKNLAELCPNCRQGFKREPLAPFLCKNKECQEILEGGPKPIDSLSEESRLQLKEVLETAETSGVLYEVNPALIDNRLVYGGTLFEIKNEEGLVIARGGRYDQLSKRIGLAKKMSAVGATILLKNISGVSKPKPAKPKKAPLGYLIQLGFEARGKSLATLEMLRSSHIDIGHSLIKDGLSVQLISAEKSKAEYSLIIGQKEVIDGTVIIRHIQNRSQSIVKMADLVTHLKTLKTTTKKK